MERFPLRRSCRLIFPLVLLAVSLLSGCEAKKTPLAPIPSPLAIVIDPDPDSLDAPWALAGPDAYSLSGNGDHSLAELPPGEYALTWGLVAGWISPLNSTQTLFADSTLTFSGIYSKEPVDIRIPPTSVPMPVTFTMGSPVALDETPHQVTLSNRFYMASTEVTNAQYVAALQWAYDSGHVTATTSSVRDDLDGSTEELLDLDDPRCQISFRSGVFSTSFPDHPVVEVSWYGAVAYCDWLSLRDGLDRAYDHNDWHIQGGHLYATSGYRLPTEAEWELACRAGTSSHFNTGDCLDAGTEANYNGESPYTGCLTGPFLESTAEAGSYSANQWGLFDMHGNVFEWCNDWYGSYDGDEADPEGADSGPHRILRGGKWNGNANSCRSSYRHDSNPGDMRFSRGFRPVRLIN